MTLVGYRKYRTRRMNYSVRFTLVFESLKVPEIILFPFVYSIKTLGVFSTLLVY